MATDKSYIIMLANPLGEAQRDLKNSVKHMLQDYPPNVGELLKFIYPTNASH